MLGVSSIAERLKLESARIGSEKKTSYVLKWLLILSNSTTVSLVDPPQGPASLSLEQTFLPYHSLPELSKTMIIRLVPATDSIHVALRNCGYCPLLEVVALAASHVAYRASFFANSVCVQSSTDSVD